MDFRATTVASVQLCWDNLAGADVDTKIQFWVSNVRTISKFICFPDSEISIKDLVTEGLESHMYLFSNGVVAFRYGQLRYIAGGVTSGTGEIIAVGKKGGGVI